jgi:ferredoxin
MIDLIKLAKLADLWGTSPPHVLEDRCLNVRHQGRGCRICVESCPANAISIPEGRRADSSPVVLDQELCARCGLCLNACPTGVFAQADPPESKLPQLVARSPSQIIELACPRKEQPDMSRVPEANVVQTPRCLAALSVPALLGLATMGKSLWLNDSLCHTCPIGEARRAIQRNITTANRWLEIMGHPSAIHSHLDGADQLDAEPTPRTLICGDRPAVSRRDFFKSLAGRTEQGSPAFMSDSGTPRSEEGQSITSEPVDAHRVESGDDIRHGLHHHIPAQRQHLAHALRQLSPDPTIQVPTAALPVADVMVTDACTACGLCAQFCPTEAIVFLSDSQYYVLHFSAALCLGEDCSLCAIGCPTDAVHFGQAVMADELLSTRPRPVKAGRLAPCFQCGALTDTPMDGDEADEAPLCYVCQAQAGRAGLSLRDQPDTL